MRLMLASLLLAATSSEQRDVDAGGVERPDHRATEDHREPRSQASSVSMLNTPRLALRSDRRQVRALLRLADVGRDGGAACCAVVLVAGSPSPAPDRSMSGG